MVHTGIPRRWAIVPAAFLMLPLGVAACAARGSGETTTAAATAPAAPVEATPIAPPEAADPPAEATDPPVEADDPPAEPVGGIFTEAQADRGRTTFDEVCSECHTSSEFRGRLFQSNWGRRTVYSFYRTVRSTMPDDNPGGLDEQVYLDVVSYVLSQNGHDAGAAELSADSPMREVRMAPDSVPGAPPNGGV